MAGTRWGESMKKSHEIGAEEEQIAWGMVGHCKDMGLTPHGVVVGHIAGF